MSQQEPISTARRTARVKWFNYKTGYGFLTDCVSAEEVFVHHTSLIVPENTFKTLRLGEYVEYETSRDTNDKIIAVKVSGVQLGPLMCQSAQQARKQKETSSSNKQTLYKRKQRFRSGEKHHKNVPVAKPAQVV